MRQLGTLLVLIAIAFRLCGPAGASEFEIADAEEAYLRIRERLVYIEAAAIPSNLACSPTVKKTGKVSKGTGYLLNGHYVITAFHVVDVAGVDERHCFVVYREGERAAPLVGTPRYLPGTTETRLRLGDQDVAIFQLVTPVRGLEDCPPLIDVPSNAGNRMFLVGYRGDEINIAAGRAIGQARRYQQNLLANCEKTGVCEMGGLIPGGHSGSPVIDAREQLVGIVQGDDASTGTTFIEPVLGLRSAIGSVCSKIRTARVPGLELVDLSFAKRVNEDSFPVLDVKMRNTGNVAYIKRGVFNVQKIWQVKTGWEPGNVCASWNYEVLLPILGNPNPVVIRMSQEVKSGSTDRFTFTLGNDAPPGLEQYAFLVDVTLLYDEDDKVLQLPKLFFLADSARANVARNSSGDFRAAFVHNLRIVDELGPFSGVMNEDAQELVTRHSERSVPAHLERLKSTIPERRKTAATALAMLGYRAAAALTALQKVAGEDEDEDVRKAARAAEADIRRSIDGGGSAGAKAPLVIDRDQILTAKDNCIRMDGTPADDPPLESDEVASSIQYRAADLLEKGEFDAAIAKATQAINGGYYLARFTRGRAYLSTGSNEAAVADFTALIERDGDYYDWNRANRALGYFRLGRIAEARADYDKAVAMSSGRNEGILAARGRFLVAVGERKAGIADYRAAIAGEPGAVRYYANLAEALLVDDQYSAALKIIGQIGELASEQTSRRSLLTMAEFIETTATLCSGGQRPDAKERLLKQLAQNSKPAWSFAELDRWIARTQCRADELAQIRDLVALLR